MSNYFKSFLLLTSLTLLLLFLGYLIGGRSGVLFGFLLASGMNFGAYWFSDKVVLSVARAQPLGQSQAPELYGLVRELAEVSGLPMPRIFWIPSAAPNAFASGRGPRHSVIAVTKGIFDMLSEEEIRGVLAHEMAHIANRDILISSIAATLAGLIGMLVSVLQWSFFLGGGRSRDRDSNPLVIAATFIFLPLAAMLIRLAVSRSREYVADERGAFLCGNPLYLASALRRIELGLHRIPMREVRPTSAHLFIVSPLSGHGFARLFRTHPPIEERIAKLERMARG